LTTVRAAVIKESVMTAEAVLLQHLLKLMPIPCVASGIQKIQTDGRRRRAFGRNIK